MRITGILPRRLRTGACSPLRSGRLRSPASVFRPRSIRRRRPLPSRRPAREVARCRFPTVVPMTGAMCDHVDGHARGCDQARVADHPREQVVRRDLLRPQPEQLSLANAAPAGSPAHQLLRHRPLHHGQLHLAGVRPSPLVRRAGRLLDDGGHDERQPRDHHRRHGGQRHRHRRHRRRLGHLYQHAESDQHHQRQLRPAPHARRRRRRAGRQRLRLPDRRSHSVQPAQRGRLVMEGLRPGPRG